MDRIRSGFRHLFCSAYGPAHHILSRWLFLRALGLIYLSAFFALLFQVRGLIGAQGILPAADYLKALSGLGILRFWYAPSLLWLSPTDHLLMGLCWAGLIASLLLVVNVWPRGTLLTSFLCFLSFVSVAQDFSGYQSDGMLLEAGFLALFIAPPGGLPGLGSKHPPIRAAMLLLIWEWFRIYFQSGVVKLESGDPTWRNLTAMYEYYQNGPLPTWIGWYLQHLPPWFHIASAAATLLMELVLVWMAFLPGRWKVACFVMVTAWQAIVIASANYAFLNYLVLVLAMLLLEDRWVLRMGPVRWRDITARRISRERGTTQSLDGQQRPKTSAGLSAAVWAGLAAVMLTSVFYVTLVPLVRMFWRNAPISAKPVEWFEPFRIANQYGLFAVMTPHRYEIEFQGSNDGEHWIAYPFRYKPQDVKARPRIYAPYQPRFDWNLWFASLGSWRENLMVPRTEELLMEQDGPVLGLFAGNSFPDAPPRMIRAVLWQYWFSSPEEKRRDGVWWRRQFLGTYAPTLTRLPDGRIGIVEPATAIQPLQP